MLATLCVSSERKKSSQALWRNEIAKASRMSGERVKEVEGGRVGLG